MSTLFSRPCEYALQAVSYLALQPAGKKTSIKELTQRLKIPYHFLAKILQNLTYKKILVSQKGPSGGFALALPPERITLYHIVEAIDGSEYSRKCVMGFPKCSSKNPCAVHYPWASIREGITSMLATKSVAEMVKAMKKPEYRSTR